MYLQKRGGSSWRVRVTINKHTYSATFKAKNEAEAQKKAAAFEAGLKDKKVVKEIDKDGIITSSMDIIGPVPEEIRDLMEYHGYSPELFDLVSARTSEWDYSWGEGFSQKRQASKIVVKPKKQAISWVALEEAFYNLEAPPKIEVPEPEGSYMVEIPIMDLHLGKLGWAPETGENYDHKIAEDRFFYIIAEALARTKRLPVEKFLFPIGNDFFQFDNPEQTTTAGTFQHSDVRWQKMFLKGISLLTQAIEMLAEVAPVECFYVPGNHDLVVSFYATQWLAAYFRNTPEIIVDTEPQVRKYISYGNVLLGFTHGDKEKKRLEGLMQAEVPELWGASVYREWHLAHFHSEITWELFGIIFRRLSSPTGIDAWHYLLGFIGAVKKAQLFIWHKENGLMEILHVPILKEVPK